MLKMPQKTDLSNSLASIAWGVHWNQEGWDVGSEGFRDIVDYTITLEPPSKMAPGSGGGVPGGSIGGS